VSGQTKIEGPTFGREILGLDLTVQIPTAVRRATFACPALRSVLVALLVVAATSPATAGSEPSSAPPPLTSATSQFVELRPLDEAPPLRLERIDGKMVDLRSPQGKVVLLSFWATWCLPCRRELPTLERLARMEAARNVEVVAVSVDQAGKPAVTTFLARISVRSLRPFLDPEGRIAAPPSKIEAAPFVLYGMPISYIIDRQGRVAGYITGEVDWTSDEGLALLRHYAEAE
jgi:thiol-disulfide isomerase/thioredoxin